MGANGTGEERGGTDEHERGDRGSRPHQAPDTPGNHPERRPDRQGGGQRATGRTAADRGECDDHLEKQEDRKQAEGKYGVECGLSEPPSIAQNLWKRDGDGPDRGEDQGHRDQNLPRLRTAFPRDFDRPHERRAGNTEQRAGDERPDDEGGRDRKWRQAVQGCVWDDDSGHEGGDYRGRQGDDDGGDA